MKRATFLCLAGSLLALSACSSSRYALIDHTGEVETFFQDGRYPSFAVENELQATVDLSRDVRRSLTPPFPARVVFLEVDIPPAAFLEVAPALVSEQLVRRARVEFQIWLELEGERFEVYREPFRAGQSNEWHHRRIALDEWAGKRVALTFETRPVPDRKRVLWADRIQTVWGEPIIVSSPTRQAIAEAGRWTTSVGEWLERQAVIVGISAAETQTTFRFALSLLVGGLVSLFIRELYKRYGTTIANREEFANLFPLFTLTTIVVIFIVKSSLALSLGLLGALSIIRFRSAIKSPEELVYLLFCVAVGLSLGANQVLLSFVVLGVVALFVLIRPWAARPASQRKLILTMSGVDESFFDQTGTNVAEKVRDIIGGLTLQRLDRDGDRFQLRAILSVDGTREPAGIAAKLREEMPGFEFSCVDLDDVL